MKKFLISILVMVALTFSFGACEKEPQNNEPIIPPVTETQKEGDPEFPNNEFGNDNEATYPDGWN